jgi:hypothetical protein
VKVEVGNTDTEKEIGRSIPESNGHRLMLAPSEGPVSSMASRRALRDMGST